MPIYEYECRKCKHRFEIIQKVSDRVLKKCEKCKGRVERLISSPAIQFKGTGWYVTDYAKKESKSDSDSSRSDSKSTSKQSESSSGQSDSSKKKAAASKKDKASVSSSSS